MRVIMLLILASIIAGCSSGGDQVELELRGADRRMEGLAKAIDAGTIRNAAIIKQYCQVLRTRRPELRQLVDALEGEATRSSPLYASLQRRLGEVRTSGDKWENRVAEIQAIKQGATASVYNDALSDTVNVLADLDDSLARVNAVSRDAEKKLNGSKDHGAGSQYVGNPHYGSWNHSGRGSFWAWYGQYAFFSSMFGGRHNYHDWSGRRGYSYYHDMGRGSYTSRSQYARQSATETRARKQFGTGAHKSPYSKRRAGGSGLSKASTAQGKRGAFSSTYGKKGYGGSARDSGFRTSRGASRGK